MGYRSQVRCLIYGNKENLDAFLTQHVLIEGSPVFHHFKDSLSRYVIAIGDPPIHVLELYGDDWKWYEDYQDVQAWMAFMCDAPDMDLDYEFVRVGEGTDDIERHQSSNHQSLLDVRIEIQTNLTMIKELPLGI